MLLPAVAGQVVASILFAVTTAVEAAVVVEAVVAGHLDLSAAVAKENIKYKTKKLV